MTFQHVTDEETAPWFEGGFSFQTWGFMLNDNGSTHVDSFSHLDPDPDAPTIDQMSLELFYGNAVCVDVSAIPARTDMTPDNLETALAAAGHMISPGDMLFLYTATYDRFQGTPQYLTDFPGLGEEASQWILERGVKTVGVDSPTPDNPTSKTYPCHMMCRANHITHYENLVLTEVVGHRFRIIGSPLRVVGATVGPRGRSQSWKIERKTLHGVNH